MSLTEICPHGSKHSIPDDSDNSDLREDFFLQVSAAIRLNQQRVNKLDVFIAFTVFFLIKIYDRKVIRLKKYRKI